MTPTAVYNVFHHSGSLTVACHLQSDASPCWNPETVTDGNGSGFATPGQPGLWIDQTTGKLYTYATRDDSTGGVVCFDTRQAATNRDPFCGFTALTAVGDAPLSGISSISAPAIVGNYMYAFNYAPGNAVVGARNALLCFDLTTFGSCRAQPYILATGAGTQAVQDGTYPEPAVAAIGGKIIIPVRLPGGDILACFDPTTSASCAGTWPAQLGGDVYDSSYGAPYPMLNPSGTATGLCLPTGTDPCFTMSGAPVATPAGMTSAITNTSGWNGAAFTLGPRVYVPNGNTDAVDCYDYGTSASCTNFPKTMSNLSLLYTVNADPQRPTCVWVNSDNGSAQIQNFDAYTGGACGQGPIRVLASSFVVPTQLCQPTTYTSLQVNQPAPGTYTSGTVSFQDGDAAPIPGLTDRTLDGTGTVSLTGLNLSTAVGLPQFLITLVGAQGAPGAVTVKLVWTGTNDPSCVGPGTVTNPGSNTGDYAALGDSYSSGEGNAPFLVGTDNPNDPVDHCHRSPKAHGPMLDIARLLGAMTFVACSGAETNNLVGPNPNNHEGPQIDGLNLSDTTRTVTLTIGGNDVGFADVAAACTQGPAFQGGHPHCLDNTALRRDVQKRINALAGSDATALTPELHRITPIGDIISAIHAKAKNAKIYVAGYPMLFGLNSRLYPRYAGIESRSCQVGTVYGLGAVLVGYSDALNMDLLAASLDASIAYAVQRARLSGMPVTYVNVLNNFIGHGLCDSGKPWINGVLLNGKTPLPGSYHPNADGQQAYEWAFSAAIVN